MSPETLKPVSIILWLIWAALLFGGFIFNPTNKDGTRRIPLWNRLGSSLALVAAAWVSWQSNQLFTIPHPLDGTFPYKIYNDLGLFIAIGMTLGCLGDFFMAQIFPTKYYVLGGIGSFGLGHIAYIIGVISFHSHVNTPATIILPIMLIWWLIAVALWYQVVFRNSEKKFLHYVALPYALLLSSTAGITTTAALIPNMFEDFWSPALMTIGATLFLISDLILATRLFNHGRWRLIDDVVWLTYGPGQMLIVYSVIVPLLITS